MAIDTIFYTGKAFEETAMNDLDADEALGELITQFYCGPNGWFNIDWALGHNEDFYDQIFNDGVGAKFVNGSGVDGLVIQAITPTSKLAKAIGDDGVAGTTSYLIAARDETGIGDDGQPAFSGFDTGDAATAMSNPFAFDDGDADVNPDGTTMAVIANLKGIVGSDYSDTMLGGDDRDAFSGGRGADGLQGRGGDDWLLGGQGDDRLIGGEGKDQLRGGADADELVGGNAGSTAGDGERDTFVFEQRANGDDVIRDFEVGTDRIAFQMTDSGNAALEVLSADGDASLVLGINPGGGGEAGSITFLGVSDTVANRLAIEASISVWGGTAPLDADFA
jgi:Ca2+-binding RTX toxin-like protein